jgi:hypothetical protein
MSVDIFSSFPVKTYVTGMPTDAIVELPSRRAQSFSIVAENGTVSGMTANMKVEV